MSSKPEGGELDSLEPVARMHGCEPGTVTPTTELILAREHPADQRAVSELIEQVLRNGAPFRGRHRRVYVDVTESFEAALQKSVSKVIARARVDHARTSRRRRRRRLRVTGLAESSFSGVA